VSPRSIDGDTVPRRSGPHATAQHTLEGGDVVRLMLEADAGRRKNAVGFLTKPQHDQRRLEFIAKGGQGLDRSLTVQLPVGGVRTIYARIGDTFAWLCVIGLAAALASVLVVGVRSRTAPIRVDPFVMPRAVSAIHDHVRS
jgi:hypothetical protein